MLNVGRDAGTNGMSLIMCECRFASAYAYCSCCSLLFCLHVSCWRADGVVRRVIPPVRWWRSSSSAWTAPMPRWPSIGLLTARPQVTSGSCRTASNSTLTSQRWFFSAPLLSSGQLPTSPPSTLPKALCWSHRIHLRPVYSDTTQINSISYSANKR